MGLLDKAKGAAETAVNQIGDTIDKRVGLADIPPGSRRGPRP